ncbi:MAG: type II toxin-antitoxin system RelE/ParE family toxin [Bacteroidota bacterium]
MDDYTIAFARSGRRELEELDAALVKRILQRIESLAEDPRPRGCRKLRGEENLWRIRVGTYRVVYSINDTKKSLDIIIVRHRSKAYE